MANYYYFIVESYKRANGRKLGDKPLTTQAVTIQQLTGAISRLLNTQKDVVLVEPISEEVFSQFYQERSRTKT